MYHTYVISKRASLKHAKAFAYGTSVGHMVGLTELDPVKGTNSNEEG